MKRGDPLHRLPSGVIQLGVIMGSLLIYWGVTQFLGISEFREILLEPSSGTFGMLIYGFPEVWGFLVAYFFFTRSLRAMAGYYQKRTILAKSG